MVSPKPKNIMSTASVALLLFFSPPSSFFSNASKPYTIHATLRGKKYTIPEVTTVEDVQNSLHDQSGLKASEQSVLFGGQKLKPADILEHLGVEDGSVMNVVPRKKSTSSSKKKSQTSVATSTVGDKGDVSTPTNVSNNGSGGGGGGFAGMPNMEEMLKQSGLDPSMFNGMLNNKDGEGGGMPDMAQTAKMMQDMMKSPLFEQYLNDPERMEQSRQMIMENPMMKGMMSSLPGFDEILNDKDKFRETMLAAAQMYKEMGSSMMGGMDGGMGNDLFGGAGSFGGLENEATAGSSSALDELSEGEDE